MTLNPNEEADHTQPPNRHSRSPVRGVSYGLGFAALATGLTMAANFTQIIDLFSHRWTTVVLVLAITICCVGMFLLYRLHEAQLGRSLVTIMVLIAFGTMGFGFAVGSSIQARPADKGSSADPAGHQVPPAGSSPAATATSVASAAPSGPPTPGADQSGEQIEILFPRDGDKVEWKGSVQVAFGALKPNQFVWLNVRPTIIPGVFLHACPVDPRNAERFNCGAQYGDETQSRNTAFEIWVVVVDRPTHQTFWDMQSKGRGYDVNDPPFNPIVKSQVVHIKR